MPYGIGPRRFAVAFWRALVAALAIVVLLAILDQHLSTGWRMLVLERALKAVWAATAALFAGIAAELILDSAAPRRATSASRRHLFAALKWLVVLAASSGALGYFVPDWTPLSAGFAIVTLVLWLIAGAAGVAAGR
jgi:hypothetical protein